MTLVQQFPSRPGAREEAVLRGGHGRLTVLADGLVRLEWSPDGGFEDRASTLAVDRAFESPAFTAVEHGGVLEVSTSRFRLRWDREEFSPGGLTVSTPSGGLWRYGEPTGNLGGTGRTLDDADGRIALDGGVVSRRGVAVIDDSASFLFEEDGWIATRRPGRRDLYLFAYGRDHEAAVRALYRLSGPPPVLPRWALGNWWSRYHPYTADAYLALFDRFDAERLPFSVAVIDMDWHRVGSVPPEYGSGWTGYSWERSLVPDPPAFLAALHRRGLTTTLNLHPADGVRPFEDAYPEMARSVGVDPASKEPIAFDPTDRTFLEAYFRVLHHPLEEQGVDFWWIDWQQGRTSRVEGVDPLWLLNHFHFLDSGRGGRRPMAFSRYGGPGSHRYGIGFSGDTVVSWASLAFQAEFTATAANIGYGWWSHDIGGHTRGVRDDELATRWLQLGVFSPVLRLHSANNPFIRKEPWEFPREPREAMGGALRLRHRLLPYLHTMNHRAAAGVPLVRPMYHVEPEREEAYEVPHQFAFGSELLVAPITAPRDPVTLLGAVRVWLPPGRWTDIFTATAYDGDRWAELHRGLDGVPALLRAGGILPLAAVGETDATRNPASLEVLVAPGEDGAFTLVEDDGRGDGSDLATVATALEWDAGAGVLRVGAARGPGGVVPEERSWKVTIFGSAPAGPVLVDGVPAPVATGDGRFSVEGRAAAAAGLTVEVGPVRVAPDDRAVAAVRRVLAAAQCGNPQKLRAWEVAAAQRPLAGKVAALHALDLPPSVL
ncbi:glycoside hydrolase family 31 protein, partial [Streptomyces fuscigenes]|uniref:glycoside hydrolase family 31 protein n=1 Tax=Streptomyces fuscigenes TaxID=1528880 RepID=UPI001F3472D0